MTNEEMQSTMQFILEHQAQFTVRLEKDEERIARLENAFALLVQVLRNTDERMDRSNELLNTLNEKMVRLAEAQAQTDERLNALISVVDRYISGRENGSQQE